MRAHWFALVVLVAGCTAAGPSTPAPLPPTAAASTTAAPTAVAPPCVEKVRRDVLPQWARTGFSDPSPSGIPYVLGDRGSILGVIFGYPLTAPPAGAGRANKILWVANPAAGATGPLAIDARLEGSTEVVHREVPGGPGPSIVDMPRAGCWRLTLAWAGQTDTLDLRYRAAS
jgi:hypothetical protein